MSDFNAVKMFHRLASILLYLEKLLCQFNHSDCGYVNDAIYLSVVFFIS